MGLRSHISVLTLGQLTAPLEEQSDTDSAAGHGDYAQWNQNIGPVKVGTGGIRGIEHRLHRLEGSSLKYSHISGLVQRDPADS